MPGEAVTRWCSWSCVFNGQARLVIELATLTMVTRVGDSGGHRAILSQGTAAGRSSPVPCARVRAGRPSDGSGGRR